MKNYQAPELNMSSTRQFIRFGSHASRKINKPEKIPVQLFQDLPRIGQRGQIIMVKPAYMRNFLHKDNKAGYVLNDKPRIPVVEKAARVKVNQVNTEAQTVEIDGEPQGDSPKTMSIHELAGLFSSKPSNKIVKTTSSFSTIDTPAIEFSLSELKNSIPQGFTISTPTVDAIIQKLYLLSGINVPASAVEVKANGEVVKELTSGKYEVSVSSKGEDDLKVYVEIK